MKLLGKRSVVKNFNGYKTNYIVSTITKLPMVYFNNIPFSYYLDKLNFKIIKINKLNIKVVLPLNWSHIKLYENKKIYDIIIDELGRTRIKIDRLKEDVNIFRRFDFGINLFKKEDQYKSNYFLTDNGKVINTIIIPDEILKMDNDEIIDLIKINCNSLLDKILPGWRDPLLYWDYNEDDFKKIYDEFINNEYIGGTYE